MEEKVKAFADIVKRSERVVLTCHVNADGDALGSTLGFRRVLMNMGKTADVITPDLAPTSYAFMPGYKTLRAYERQVEECDALIDRADLIVMMDYNDLGRIKTLGEKIGSCNVTKILVDHHLEPQVSAEVMVSEPEASATCQIIYKLLLDAGFGEYVDVEATSNFYAGIITDTGGLSYNSSSPELYEMVADMLRKGIDKSFIHDKIFNNKTIRRLKLQGYALHKKLHRIEGTPITVMALSAQELEQFSYNTGDTEGFVNIPLQVKDVIVSCFIMERPDGIKISLRSKGEFPVNEYSGKYFGGGGHLNAAGGTYHGTLADAVAVFREPIVEFYYRWLKRTAK